MEKERETVTWEETAYSNYLSVEAIVNLLIRKKLMTKDEILDEIKMLKHKHHSKPNSLLTVGHFPFDVRECIVKGALGVLWLSWSGLAKNWWRFSLPSVPGDTSEGRR